jgi:probable biosynthetic protein (TIGR04098 family)
MLYIKDDVWTDLISNGKCIKNIIGFINSHKAKNLIPNEQADKSKQVRMISESDGSDSTLLWPNGLITAPLEIGMPLAGRNNLAEGPLLQQLGHLRWTHMCRLAGVESKRIVDDQGNRLYPTFFYVEIAFPHDYPMAHYGENDRFKILGELKRFGTSMLDGNFYLFPENVKFDENIVKLSHDEVLSRGVSIVRFSNVFVMQFNGAEWLKKSRPSNAGFLNIPESFEPFSSYGWVKAVEKEEITMNIPKSYIPITTSPVRFEYNLVPDRDLNGAGLVYFANYPVFLDICERKLLESLDVFRFEEDLIDRRTLINRRSGYFSNALSKDIIDIEISAFIENPFAANYQHPELAPIRLIIKYRMFRKSDNRLMMISVAEKTIYGRTAEDLSFYNNNMTGLVPPH